MPVQPGSATEFLRRLDDLPRGGGMNSSFVTTCRLLRETFPHYSWVGIYRLEHETLLLEGWAGERPTEHTRIPIARGICGQAVREGRVVRVGDVRDSKEYLACFLETRSELVVPIRLSGRIVGEIDIDGTELNAFDESDERMVTEVALRLAPQFAGNRSG